MELRSEEVSAVLIHIMHLVYYYEHALAIVTSNDVSRMYSFLKIILEKLWSEKGMKEVVECCNGEGKTALELGVEKECIE